MADNQRVQDGITNHSRSNHKLAALIHNKKFSLVLRIVLTAAFFAIVNKSISVSDIRVLSGDIEIPVLLAVLFSGVAGLYFQVLRWKEVLKSVKLPHDGVIPIKTLLWGNFLGFLTPGRVGELFRGMSIDTTRKTDSFIATLIDRFYAILMVLLFSFPCIIIQLLYCRVSLHSIEWISIIVLVTVIILFFIFLKYDFFSSVISRIRLDKILKAIRQTLTPGILFLSILAHTCLLLQTVLLLQMFGSAGWLKNTMIAGLAYMQILFLPISIANVGIREYSFGLYLKLSGIDTGARAIAFGVSGAILFFNILLPAFAGLAWFFFDKKRTEKIKQQVVAKS